MIWKEKQKIGVSKLFLLLSVCLIFFSCTVKSTGGYVIGQGNSRFFEPVHATAVEVLVPTLDNNYCHMLKESQKRRYETRERLVEVDGRAIDKSMAHQYEFSNKCE